jgi:hypothetical protein
MLDKGFIHKGIGALLIGCVAVAGCTFFQQASTPGTQQTEFSTGVAELAKLGCSQLSAADQAITKQVVVPLQAQPADAIAAALVTPTAGSGLPGSQFYGLAWQLLNGALGALPVGQYSALLPIAAQAVVTGCCAGLP